MAPLTTALDRIRSSEPDCLGPLSSVQVWRTADGAVHRLLYSGDIRRCSHPPSTWFSAEGTLLEMVPSEPVTDENRAHYEALWARHTAGAAKAESLPIDEERSGG